MKNHIPYILITVVLAIAVIFIAIRQSQYPSLSTGSASPQQAAQQSITSTTPTPVTPLLSASDNTNKKQAGSFIIQHSGNKVKLTIPPIVQNQSACIWRETSPDYATGANIFTTQSIDPQGNSYTYDYGQDVAVSAFCQDKFGDSGDVYVQGINIKDIK